jgi:iron complex transport system permease protein
MSQSEAILLRKKKRRYFLLIAIFLLFITAILNLLTGYDGVHIQDITKLFSNEHSFSLIIYQIRLPRVFAAILAGALLALSGALMQGTLKNPLASPFTLGISQAAGFGASFAIIILQAYTNNNQISSSLNVALCAFLASTFCMLIILLLGKLSSLSPSSMILAGVGLGSLFHALTMFLQYFADDLEVSATLFWTFGELGKANWNTIFIMAAVFIPIYIYFLFSHWKMDAMSFGDESAKSRGVEVDKFRFLALLAASLLAAIAVSFLGIIGFVGLVAPHLVRMILGNSHFSTLPFSALVGAILLLSADFVAKIVLAPIILPIGIVTAFMGVPIFLYLLLKKGR